MGDFVPGSGLQYRTDGVIVNEADGLDTDGTRKVKLALVNTNPDGSVKIAPFDKDLDSFDVGKMSRGLATVALNAVSATTQSGEVDCRGYNSVILHCVVTGTGNWNISVQYAPVTGGTFVDAYDGTSQIAVNALTTNKAVYFRGVTDIIKVTATLASGTGTLTATAIPLNI